MKSSKPLSFSIFDDLKRFDSGLRQYLKVGETLILQRFSYFCFKKLMKLDLIDSVAMEEVAGFLDKLLSKDKYEGRREANMKYVVE